MMETYYEHKGNQPRRKTGKDEQKSPPDPVGNKANQKENQRNQDPVRKGENWKEGEEK